MSALSGIAGKGDKSKAKFKTIDINNVYKGTSVGPQKTAGKLYALLMVWAFENISSTVPKISKKKFVEDQARNPTDFR